MLGKPDYATAGEQFDFTLGNLGRNFELAGDDGVVFLEDLKRRDERFIAPVLLKKRDRAFLLDPFRMIV